MKLDEDYDRGCINQFIAISTSYLTSLLLLELQNLSCKFSRLHMFDFHPFQPSPNFIWSSYTKVYCLPLTWCPNIKFPIRKWVSKILNISTFDDWIWRQMDENQERKATLFCASYYRGPFLSFSHVSFIYRYVKSLSFLSTTVTTVSSIKNQYHVNHIH